MPSSEVETPLSFDGFTIDLRRRGLYRGDARVHLTPTPFKVLAFLAQHRGSVVSKEDLLNAVWRGQRHENTVEQAIRQIRRALGDETDQSRFIRTIPGVGYCFIAEITDQDGSGNEPEHGSPVQPTESGPRQLGRRQAFIRRAVALSGMVVCAGLLYILALQWGPSRIQAVNPTRLTDSQAVILSPLLADASQIAYPQYEAGRYSMAAISVRGGEGTPILANVPNPELCDVTQDGSAILLRNLVHSRNDDESLYVQFNGGVAQRVGNILAYDAAWYPGTKRILYSADGVLYSTDVTGRSEKRLFSVPGNAYWFRWSPNGNTLRFTVINSSTEATSIWEVDAGSDKPHRILPGFAHYQCCGTWTPDGKFFIFQVRIGSTFQIWARRELHHFWLPAKSQPFPLIYGAVSYRGPLVSKDGKTLLVRAENPKGETVRYNSKSEGFVPLLPSISARTLAFSKDGNWIAYTAIVDGSLWRCHSDGKQCIQLTRGFRNTLMPAWSPDGRSIAFMAVRYAGDWGIYVVPAEGGATHRLINWNKSEGYPDWSPDGQRLVFSEIVPLADPEGVHVLDLRTNQTSTLPGSKGLSLARWSPDGRHIVALHSGNQYPYLFDSATSMWRLLAKLPANYPNWSRDGKEVYLLAEVGGSRVIFRVNIADQRVEKLAVLKAIEDSPFILGDWIGLTPDDEPLAVQNMTTDDIYKWDLIEKQHF